MVVVKSITSLGRSGLHDWFIQRLSAVVMALYAGFFAVFLISNPDLSYQAWVGLFSDPIVKAISILVVILLSLHIWIGMWIVSTDYIKPVGIRMVFQGLLILFCLVLILWGIQILWSV